MPQDTRHLDRLARLFPDYRQLNLPRFLAMLRKPRQSKEGTAYQYRSQQFAQLHRKLINISPTIEEVERMILDLTQAGIYINPFEIDVEIEAGRLVNTNNLQALIRAQGEMLREWGAEAENEVIGQGGFQGF